MLKRLKIDEAVRCMADNGLVVFPTETSYALGCRAFSKEAVTELVSAKGRPDGKPLPVILPGADYLAQFAIESPLLQIGRRFWPGPLTVVLPCFPNLASQVSGSTNMVGVRVSSHPVARELAQRIGEPIVATSANVSGSPAAVSPSDCDQAGLIGVSGLVDSGLLTGGASTVIGLSSGGFEVFREGPISREEREQAWSELRTRP